MELGPRTEHLTTRSPWKVWILAFLVALPCGVAAIFAFVALTPHQPIHAPSLAVRLQRLAIVLGVVAVVVWFGLWLARRLRPTELEVFRDGFVLRRGGSTRTVAWSRVRSMKDVRGGQLRILRLETEDGPLELHAHLYGNDVADAIWAAAPQSTRA